MFFVFFCILIPEYRWKSKWKPRVCLSVLFAVTVWGFLSNIEGHYSISWQNLGSLNNGYIFKLF